MGRRAIVVGLGVGAVALQIFGCATEPLLSDAQQQLLTSRAAIAAAETARASQFAPEDLSRARTKMDLLLNYLGHEEYRYAMWLGEQAQVDADLARVKALIRQRGRGPGT